MYVPTELAGLSGDHTETFNGLCRQGCVMGPKARHHKWRTVLKRDVKRLLSTVRMALPFEIAVAKHQTSASTKAVAEHRLLAQRLSSRIDRFWHLGIFCPCRHKSPGQGP